MGFISEIISFLGGLASGSTFYEEDSITWCDNMWECTRKTVCGEARLIMIDNKVYHQLFVVFEHHAEGYFTDLTDHGCSIEYLHLKRSQQIELEHTGYITLKKYR